jgi:four helix bundle protein
LKLNPEVVATFRQFEDILAWQKARELVARLYQVSMAGDFSRDFAMKDQMRRASLSIPSNIAEGFERGGRKEFILFLGHAKGSCGELRSQLYHALDQAYLDEPTWRELHDACLEISRLLDGLMQYLQQTEIRGRKYTPAAGQL